MLFYLGAPEPRWLWQMTVPLFVSRRRLVRQKRPKQATCQWALDSGGFTELSKFGRWTVSAAQYVEEVRGWMSRVGGLAWAAAQDWMCEPVILQQTGLTVADHQRHTVANYLELRDLAPEVPWAPVLQGWLWQDYLVCADLYASAGVDLATLPVVGLGSVCRRQDTTLAEELIRHFHGQGVKLHGFGFKLNGLRAAAPWLTSSDSMAWSYNARRNKPLPGCPHLKCANCPKYALRWRERVVRLVEDATTPALRQRLLW